MSASQQPVGVVGLGNMGMAVAERLVAQGFAVHAYDVREAARDEASRKGMAPVESLQSLAAAVDVVLVVVVDDAQVLSVVDGLAAHLRRGALVLVLSSVLPRTIAAAAERARAAGVDLVDTAVTGGSGRARDGDLTVLVGSDQNTPSAAQAVLDAIGSHVFHLGGLGMGEIAKFVNNVIAIGSKICAYQAMELARAYGIDEATARAVVESGTGDCWNIRNWEHNDRLFREHPLGAGFVEISSKDLTDAVAAARDMGVHLPVVALLAEIAPSIYARRAEYLDIREEEHA